MRKSKLFTIGLLILIVSLSLMGCSSSKVEETNSAGSEEPVVIKFGHQMSPTSTEGQAYEYFADLVEERTNGSVKIILYPAEQLGDSKSQIESTLLGTQDVVATGASLFSRFDPIFNALTVPFLFKDNSSFSKLMQGDVGKMQQQALLDNNLVLINTARNMMRGPYRVLVSKKPVNSVEDIEGIRFRTYENDVYMNAWKTLGANPIVIPWGETYMALMQDTVEAAVSPMSSLYSMKFTEVAKYVAIINEYTSDCIWAMNKDKFDSLTEEQQNIIIECANEAGEYLSEIDKKAVEEDIKKMEKENGAVFVEIDTDPFREKLVDYYYQLEADGELPKGLVEEALGK